MQKRRGHHRKGRRRGIARHRDAGWCQLRLSGDRDDKGAVVARIYDPTYFIAYSASDQRSSVRNAGDLCRVDVTPFEATPALFDLQTTLAALSREETPAQQNVGALFADVVTLTCE